MRCSLKRVMCRKCHFSDFHHQKQAICTFCVLSSLYHEISHQPKLPVSSITSLRENAVCPDTLKTTIRDRTDAQLVRGHMEDLFWIPVAFPFHRLSQFLWLPQPPLRILPFQLASQKSYHLPSLPGLLTFSSTKGKVQFLGYWKGRLPVRCIRAAVATAWGPPGAWSSVILTLTTWCHVRFPRLRALPSVQAPAISSKVPSPSSL